MLSYKGINQAKSQHKHIMGKSQGVFLTLSLLYFNHSYDWKIFKPIITESPLLIGSQTTIAINHI